MTDEAVPSTVVNDVVEGELRRAKEGEDRSLPLLSALRLSAQRVARVSPPWDAPRALALVLLEDADPVVAGGERDLALRVRPLREAIVRHPARPFTDRTRWWFHASRRVMLRVF